MTSLRDPSVEPGTLYVVSTPIGNLEDLSPRAIRILGLVDRILCEDTRRTRRLLDRIGLRKPLVSHHEHNEAQNESRVMKELASGVTFALVTDAGTPGVSDPGFRLVRTAGAAGVPVVPIPGPSAVMTALAVAGLPTDRFHFLGFLPPRRARREELLREVGTLRATLVLFESPHALKETLAALEAALGDRRAALCRELTKLHEEIVRGTLAELLQWSETKAPRGEFTIVVEGARSVPPSPAEPNFVGVAREMFERLIGEGLDPEEAARRTRDVFGG